MNDEPGEISTVPLREPSDRASVSLSEALTWIAFRHAWGTTGLHNAIEIKEGPFAEQDHGFTLLEEALQRLHDATAMGALRVRGFFAQHHFLDEARRANAEMLTADNLATFRQFDVRTGGLQRQPIGYPAVIWQVHEFSRAFKGRADRAFADGYLEVEVERVGLLREFPSPAQPVRSTRGAEADCQRWLADQFIADPRMLRSKPNFR